MLSRRSLLAVTAALALVAVSSAAGEEFDGYTATGAPSHVKPSTQAEYTIALKNKAASPEEADHAKIGIPAGFVVAAATVQASASAAGACVASTWIADGTLIDDGKINLKRPGGGSNNRLCPGGTLTVVFSATSSAAEGSFTWATELLRGEEDSFIRTGPQPTVQVDGTPPTVTINSHPPDPSNDPSPTFAFSANEAASLECKLDGGAFAACASPKSYVAGDGSHTFTLKATDAAGNSGQTSYGWTIDATGPATAITQRPGDPTNDRSASFAFAANEPSTFQCKLDDGAYASCTSPQTYTNLAEGRHTFVVRASDALSNIGPEAAYAWTIETRAPALEFTSAPPALSNSTTASFSFSADEPASFQCNLDDRGFEPCSAPASYAGLPEGGHAFAVRATDAAGNVAAVFHAWTIDATPPQTTLDSRPRARTAARSATFVFSANERGTFQCRLDTGSFAPCGSPKTYARLKDGVHRFMVRAIDAAGNADATPAASQWTIGRAATRTAAASALFAPAAGTRLTRPPLLRWRAVPRASYYNVQLYRGGRKVLTAWPSRTGLQLRMQWRFNGRVQRLKPGLYRWYVWPAYGRAADRRYGRLLGTSTFVVARTIR
jgi:hypothetical protein